MTKRSATDKQQFGRIAKPIWRDIRAILERRAELSLPGSDANLQRVLDLLQRMATGDYEEPNSVFQYERRRGAPRSADAIWKKTVIRLEYQQMKDDAELAGKPFKQAAAILELQARHHVSESTVKAALRESRRPPQRADPHKG